VTYSVTHQQVTEMHKKNLPSLTGFFDLMCC
jgi:hypothetical protein